MQRVEWAEGDSVTQKIPDGIFAVHLWPVPYMGQGLFSLGETGRNAKQFAFLPRLGSFALRFAQTKLNLRLSSLPRK